jgi:lysine-specific demethylase 8
MPSLMEDFDIPTYAGDSVGSINSWFGTAGTVTRLHYDTYENLLTQVVGYKYIRLYAPSQTPKLYAIPPKIGTLVALDAGTSGNGSVPALPAATHGSNGKKKGGKHKGGAGDEDDIMLLEAAAAANAAGTSGGSKSKGKSSGGDATTAQGNISRFDVDNPDYDAYPLAESAEFFETVLGPGDILYIPAGWWHFVRSLTPSFSINFWF